MEQKTFYPTASSHCYLSGEARTSLEEALTKHLTLEELAILERVLVEVRYNTCAKLNKFGGNLSNAMQLMPSVVACALEQKVRETLGK